MSKIIGCTLIALVVLQVHYANSFVLESAAKDGVVKVLEALNSLTNKIETYGDDFITEKLKNETGIKEWSATIQAEIATKVTIGIFLNYEFVKKLILEYSPTEAEVKLLDCISAEEDNIFATVKSAFTNNGWCNNRLAANLTRGLKVVSSSLLDINSQVKVNLDTLSSCSGTDLECFSEYAQEVVALIKDNIDEGDLGTGLQEVLAIYKIMFGEDAPRCNEEVLFPQLQEGLTAAVNSILACSAN